MVTPMNVNAARETHAHVFCNSAIGAFSLFFHLDVVCFFDYRIANDNICCVVDHESFAVVDSANAEGESLRMTVWPEEGVILVQRVPAERQSLAVSHPDALQDPRLAAEDVVMATNIAHPVGESRRDSFIYVKTWKSEYTQ